MNLSGKVLNALSQLPVKGAQLFVMAADGSCSSLGATDVLGNYNVKAPDNITKVIVAAKGFQSVLSDPGYLDQNEVQLMPSQKINGTDTPPLWFYAAAGGIFLFGGKKKEVGAASDYAAYIIPVGLVVGGYFLIKNLFGGLGDLFTGANTSNATATTQQSTTATQSSLDQAAQQGINQTKTDAQLSGLAVTIGTIGGKQIGTASEEDQDAVVNDIIQSVETLTDYLKVKQFFGVKKVATGWLSTCYALGFNCDAVDLDAFLHLILDPEHIDDIINYFYSQGINYQL